MLTFSKGLLTNIQTYLLKYKLIYINVNFFQCSPDFVAPTLVVVIIVLYFTTIQ